LFKGHAGLNEPAEFARVFAEHCEDYVRTHGEAHARFPGLFGRRQMRTM
jgi:hypothetical protein